MKIENFDYFSQVNLDKTQKTAKLEDLDINIKVSPQNKVPVKELITSKIFCTPGCTNGTGHSFCC